MSTDVDLSNSDEQARTEALDVRRSFIVQAPAGSGKTELLIQRFLKLLVIVDNPEEVLAITFTRKAAAEMRNRVIDALKASLRGEQAKEAHQITTAAAAAAVLQRDRELDWNIIANPSRLKIQTLDSVNAAISRMQPVSSGTGAAHNSVVADAEMRSLYHQAAFLTLDQLTEDSGELPEATRAVLSHLDNNTTLFGNYLARMLASRDQWLPFIGSGRIDSGDAQLLRAKFERTLSDEVLRYLRALDDLLPDKLQRQLPPLAQYAAKQLVDAGATANPIADLETLESLPGVQADAVVRWRSLAELLLTRQGQWRKTVTKAQGFPPKDAGQKDAFITLLTELTACDAFRMQLDRVRDLPAPTYNDAQWTVLLALFRLLPLAATELKRLFAERGVTDYIEVALSAANALGTADDPGDVALLLDYQIRHLLIDEMQDTASAQYSMLEALTGGWQTGDGRTLFCVGDPMQSIYRFRNAEVGQFLLAKEAGIGNIELQNLTLRRNFRSGENLVDWFNQLFPSVLAARDDASQSAVAYEPSVAVSQHAGQGSCVIHALFGSDPEAEAERGSELVHEILAANPDDDLAILVRSRTHLNRLLANLRRAGIAYRSVEIDRLTDLPEIIDVLALTRALNHRGDRLAWLALLRAPWAGLNWTDLHTLVKDASRSTPLLELLLDEERLTRLSQYGQAAVRKLLQVLGPELGANRISSLRDQLERLWLALGGPAILQDPANVANVYRYFDVIEELEHAGSIPDIARLEAALDLEHVSSDSDARLQVMTMHRAKGLQFDHVLLYGLGHAPGQQERTVLNWLDIPGPHGQLERIVSPVGPRAELENDVLHRFIETREAEKNRHELGRLLYVACTRAKKSLHLLGHVGLNGDESAFRPPRTNTLLHLLWPALQTDFARAFAERASQAAAEADTVWGLPMLRRFETEWQLPEISAPAITASESPDDDTLAEVEFYWVGSDARIAGTLVHRWLQLITDKQAAVAELEPSAVRETSLHWLRGSGISGAAADAICERVALALQQTFSDAKGQWLIDGPGSTELALSGVVDGAVTSVVLDRVRIDEQGVHWIVDYKTSTHEGGNPQAFLQAEVERYSPQLAKYQEIYRNFTNAETRCALYFPLLKEFVTLSL